MEEWRDIEDYKGLYQVSNMGRVKSLERTVWNGRGYYVTIHERILKPKKDRGGYLQVHLCKDGKAKFYTVHKLVATVFCENPEGYTEINHKDEDKTNNNADNLEWCSKSYNNSYNGRAKKAGKKISKPVIGINKVSGLILEFPSAREAEKETGIAHQSICSCLKGRLKSTGGYVWYYAD